MTTLTKWVGGHRVVQEKPEPISIDVTDCTIIGMRECHIYSKSDIEIGECLPFEVVKSTDQALVVRSGVDGPLFVIGWGLLDAVLGAYAKRSASESMRLWRDEQSK